MRTRRALPLPLALLLLLGCFGCARRDDAPETVKARLDTYHRETEPLKAFYAERGKLKTVENQPTISATTAEIKKALGI